MRNPSTITMLRKLKDIATIATECVDLLETEVDNLIEASREERRLLELEENETNRA